MKKLFLLISVLFTLVSCSQSFEEKAAQEAKDFTRKKCPTPYINMVRTDSCSFDQSSKTYCYYCSINGQIDRADIIAKNKIRLKDALIAQIKDSPALKAYKEAGFKFRYIYRSASTRQTLLDVVVSEHDYR